MKKAGSLALVAGTLSLALACAVGPRGAAESSTLVEIARSPGQWTGVAVGPTGRVFVNFPRWSAGVPISVGELLPSGEVAPFPDAAWNSWSPGDPTGERFVCVQSVVVDAAGFLWALDAGNPWFQGIQPGAPKLIKLDPRDGRVMDVFPFREGAVRPRSYLNDVRVDVERGWAYITDSGVGALVTVDLKAKKSRRLLEGHPSVGAEEIPLVVAGVDLKKRDGSYPKVHADGIALDTEGRYLYYQALTGKSLYRIDTAALRGEGGPPENAVEFVAGTFPADGLWFGRDGALYLTSITDSAIKRWTPRRGIETVVQDARLAWPDSLAEDPAGRLYVTTSQIHLGPEPAEPYRIFAFKPR